MVSQGEITLGQLVTVNGYLWMLNNPLRQAGWLVNDISNFTTSVEKIYATYSEEPHVKTPVSGLSLIHIFGLHNIRRVARMYMGDISLEQENQEVVLSIMLQVDVYKRQGICM